jgi:hypothetical protein
MRPGLPHSPQLERWVVISALTSVPTAFVVVEVDGGPVRDRQGHGGPDMAGTADPAVHDAPRPEPWSPTAPRGRDPCRGSPAGKSRKPRWRSTGRWPRLYEISSMPMRRRLPNRSLPARASALTRLTMLPTVRHAIRSSAVTAVLSVRVASQAAVSSKARVWPAPWRAHGTEQTTTPWSLQRTRGTSASMYVGMTPRSSARHRRGPGPRPYWPLRRRQTPHRPASAFLQPR